MPFVPGCTSDIFISYSHIDNEPPLNATSGWVDFFEDVLRKRLRVRLGRDVEIFRDPQLRTFGKFSKQLTDKLSTCAVFVCVTSTPYLESDWCLHELRLFFERVGGDRIFKVAKSAIDAPISDPQLAKLFGQIKEVLDCRFYEREEKTKRYKDLMPEAIPGDVPVCYDKIDVIAQDLGELLKELRKSQAASLGSTTDQKENPIVDQPEQDQIAVYLAETTKDRNPERNEIRTELLQFNCRVLPDQPLPSDASDLVNVVRKYISQTKFSVHLLGADYGTVPELEKRSVPHIQYDLAAEIARDRQLVWMPEGLVPNEESQARFLEHVRNTTPDFLRTRTEDLKTEILKKLKGDGANGQGESGEDDQVNVSLFCHEDDLSSIAPLYTHLRVNEFFKVKLPLKDAESFQAHKQLLQASDAVLLYYGTADEDWLVNIWRLIQRHISASRSKPVLAKAIYAGQPPTTEKNLLLESGDLMIIKNYGQFNANSLTPFIEKIRTAKGGPR